MKGLITFSSQTGNTEKLANVLYESLNEQNNWELTPVDQVQHIEQYDVILLGFWVNRSDIDKKSKQLIQEIPQSIPVGLFGTSGGEHESEYGKKLFERIHRAMENHNLIGLKIIHGAVDSKLKSKVSGILGNFVPPHIKQHIIDMVEQSREATPEERQQVVDYFKQKL